MTRTLIVQADGGSRGNPGPAGYGALVTDAATGEVLAERAGYLGVVTNNVAEYRGLVEGLRAAREVDKDARIEVRLDSNLIVQQMNGVWKIKHPDMKALAAEARSLIVGATISFAWQPRAQNSEADALANEAMDTRKPSIRRGVGAGDAPGDTAGPGLF